jgi:UrcA family protein
MKHRKFAPLSLIAAAACTLAGGAAYGQAMEVVTVEAVREIVVGKSAIGAPIKELSIRSRVSYADLDLTTAAGLEALEKRVKETAVSTCKEMKVQIPAEGSTEEKCVKEAIDGATPQITAAVEAAKKAKR